MNYPFSDEIQGHITITPEELEELKASYNYAIDNEQFNFEYKNMELDINYASYLISHMENILNFQNKENYA